MIGKFAICALVVLCMVSLGKAQNTDLPNPTPNIQNVPAGSFVIAMDNTNQANPGYFNLKAYGLAVTLMDYNVGLRWIIRSGKLKDEIDLSVAAQSVTNPTIVTATSKITYTNGSNAATISNVSGTLEAGMTITSSAAGIPAGTTVQSIVDATHITLSANATSSQSNKNATYSKNTYPVSSYDFKAGPLIVFPADTALARQLITIYNNSLAPAEQINVFRTTAAVNADIRYNLTGMIPKAAVLDDGGNENIHLAYYTAAGIPSMNYTTLSSATGLTLGCYTFASEPHSTATGSQIDSIKSFVSLGGNFLAECHAITTYEDWTTGRFQTTGGFDATNVNIGANILWPNPDLAFCQIEGGYDANQGGSVQTWSLTAGSNYQPNFYGIVQGSTVPTANSFGASGIKLKSGKGGNVWYIGNHAFTGTAIEDINGIRMYMNALITPAATPACDQFKMLPVKLEYFQAKKQGEKQVQLSWATSSENNTKEFIIERSADGIRFNQLNKVTAKGNSTVEVIYSDLDAFPQAGTNFYRLTTVDMDGQKTYSNIVQVNFAAATNVSARVYPNPASSEVKIDLSNFPLYDNSLSISDMTGMTVLRRPAFSGTSISLNIETLKPGVYFVKIMNVSGTEVQEKLVIR